MAADPTPPARRARASGDSEELAELVVSVSARLVREAGSAADLPLSIAQARTLAHLRDAGPLRITQLAARERCAQPSMTALVARLEAGGYVERTPDPADGRASRVGITAAGSEELRTARRVMAAGLAARLGELDRDDLACLRRATQLLDRLGQPSSNAEETTTRGAR